MNRTPVIIAIILLLLSVLYVGSYLLLVIPEGRYEPYAPSPLHQPQLVVVHYRFNDHWAARFFWPLEQIDRKLRAGKWEPLEVRLKV